LFLTYQYGLRPKRHQYRRLEAIPRGQRLLYNAALKERSQAWSKSHKSLTRMDQIKSLTTIRADDPQGYGALPVNLSRWSLKKVDDAFQAFFRRIEAKRGKAGFPRFKSMRRWRSFGFCEFSGIRLIDGALLFKGMPGRLKLHLHRPLPENASIRSCTLTKHGRAWRVALQIEVADVHTIRREANKLVGIDWGVERLATLSTGEAIANPRFGAAAAAGIRTTQRKLARTKKGSRRRLKAVAHLARQRRKLANRRKTPFASIDRRDRSPLRRHSGRGPQGEEHDRVRQGRGRKSRQKRPAERRSQQGDPRHFAGHDDFDAALQGCKGRWLVRGHRREEHLAGVLGMRPHGPKGPLGPYP
jgi:putative transposase